MYLVMPEPVSAMKTTISLIETSILFIYLKTEKKKHTFTSTQSNQICYFYKRKIHAVKKQYYLPVCF